MASGNLSLLGLLGAGLLAASAVAAVYKWVDEQGVTHYSQTPPATGAKPLALPDTRSEETVRRAREELEGVLQRQQRRDEARADEREREDAESRKQGARKLLLLKSCISMRHFRQTLKKPRPVFLLNSACERVYVSDADRRQMLQLVERLVPDLCSGDPQRALDAQTAEATDRLQAIRDRHYASPGEPVSYPDFSDRDLTGSPDFCRCADRFIAEMHKPRYRTPRDEIDEAREFVGRRCKEKR